MLRREGLVNGNDVGLYAFIEDSGVGSLGITGYIRSSMRCSSIRTFFIRTLWHLLLFLHVGVEFLVSRSDLPHSTDWLCLYKFSALFCIFASTIDPLMDHSL
jgi:hypothetical protein